MEREEQVTVPIRHEALIPVSTMERIREEDRRQYRQRIIWVLTLNVLVMIGLRYMIEVSFGFRQMQPYLHLKPYSIILMLAFAAWIWGVGVWFAFQKRM